MRNLAYLDGTSAGMIGGAIAAFGAAVLRVRLGDYAVAFYISGAMCIVTSYFVLRIAKNVSDSQMRT